MIRTIIFPSQPYNLREVDPDFAEEMKAAKDAGYSTSLIDHTRLVNEGFTDFRFTLEGGALYRGWMLTPNQYTLMYEEFLVRDVELINNPSEYLNCHYFPYSYPYIESRTPRSKSSWIYIPEGSRTFSDACGLLPFFGDKAIIVKDFVKSEKHYWKEACFIPCASDSDNARKVISKFLELRGPDLNGGVVLREYHPLKIIGTHPKSGMPLGAEVRVFWLNHEAILVHPYWEGLCDFEDSPPLEEFREIASRVPSNFFTMDLALQEDGKWIIMELGDGQVSGIPSSSLIREFYKELLA